MNYIRLPLEGCKNTRDLGGYGTNIHGKLGITKWNTFFRSDCVSKLTDWDLEILDGYNLKTIIDLRSNSESGKDPNPFSTNDKYDFHHVSLAGDIDPNSFMNLKSISENYLLDLYIDIIDNKKEHVKKVLDLIKDMEDNTSIVFHCTAGKDRTGVIAMLLLGIVGVEKQDIVTNYEQSSTNLENDPTLKKYQDFLDDTQVNLMNKLLNSNKENMEMLYSHLIEKYISFENYFLELGFSYEDIQVIISKINIFL